MRSAPQRDFWTLFFAGWIWHSLYTVTGYNDVVGLIAPINESLWEHLKLGYGATLVLMVQDTWQSVARSQSSSIIGRAIGIIAMNVFVVVGFYAYSLSIGRSIVVVDIMLYGVASWIAVLIHNRINERTPSATMEYIGIALLMIIAGVFAWCTMYVPAAAIFHPQM